MVRFSVHKLHIVLLFAIVLLMAAAALSAQPFSRMVSFQARLAAPDTGKPLPDGQYQVTFTIYDAETEGNALWQEVQDVTQAGGVVNVHLGSVTPFPPKLFALSDRWLGIQVGQDQEMPDRFQFTPSPWAMFAGGLCLPYRASVQSALPVVWVENEGQSEAFFGRNVPSGNFGYVGGTQAAVYGEAPDGSFGALAVEGEGLVGRDGRPGGSPDQSAPAIFGVYGEGSWAGGYFRDSGVADSGFAWVATGDWGIWARGDEVGGVFDSSLSGIEAHGDQQGGYFTGWGTPTPETRLAYYDGSYTYGVNTASGEIGIYAEGSVMGGKFECDGYDTYVNLANGAYGIKARGEDIGGYFTSGTAGNTVYLAGQNRAGYFDGDVWVEGTLDASDKQFRIDHPLDPESMYLRHACVESSERKNVYDGVVVLDHSGEAWVELPEWFEALNRDFRYQLTCIGGFAPVYIAEKIADNCFKIAGGDPGMEVSWQVTGIRCDPYAQAHPVVVEQEKPEHERGTYLHPEVYGTAGASDLESVRHGR